ncbi:MAG: hypothetical protein U0Q16_34090 [Bryobacteraceae bacterium]
MRRYRLPITFALLATAAFAQRPPANPPQVFLGRVVNAASFMPEGLPGGGIARGSVFSIFGANLGPAGAIENTRLPLTPSLGGTAVTLTRGNAGAVAFPVYVSSSQINAIMPSSLAAGRYLLRVTVNGLASNPVPVRVEENSPGIFTTTGMGMGPAVLSNVALPAGAAAEGPSSKTAELEKYARAGQVASLWLTGMGPIARADNQAPPVGDHPFRIEAWVGGKPVPARLYAGRATALPGIDQYVFAIPDDAPEGCFVPVQVRVNGAVSNTATIPVSRDGRGCQDAHSPASQALAGSSVAFMLYRTTGSLNIGGRATSVTSDKAVMRAVNNNRSGYDPYLTPPPPGSCSTYHAFGNILTGAITPVQPGQTPLDLGEVMLDNGSMQKALAPIPSLQGFYMSLLGGVGGEPLFIGDRGVKVSAAGVSATLPPPVEIASPALDALREVNPAEGVRLEWKTSDEASVAVGGAGYDAPSNASFLFYCTAPLGATSFQVPGYVTANLPEPRAQSTRQQAMVFIGATNASGSGSPGTTQAITGIKAGWDIKISRPVRSAQ